MDAYDVVVIGAGIFGASSAYRLCEAGAGRVLLLDRTGLCGGDSGRTFGMVRRHYSNAVTARLAIRGTRTIVDWADEIGIGDAGYVRTGYLLTVPERHAVACRENVERLRTIGLETSFVEPDEIEELEPLLALDGIACGAYEPEGGFVDAQKMVLGWFAAGALRGLTARLGCTVEALLVDRGRVTGLRTSDGEISAGRVVLATGAWGPELLRPLGIELPITLAPIQVAILRQRPGGPRPNVVCSDAVTNVVVRPDRGALVYAVTYVTMPELAGADECDHDVSPDYPAAIEAALAERYPALGRLTWEKGWAGPYDATPDWNPILGWAPGVEGLYLAQGWSGHGLKLSPAVGEVVAAEVLGKTPPIDVSELRLERFERGELLRLAYGPGARA